MDCFWIAIQMQELCLGSRTLAAEQQEPEHGAGQVKIVAVGAYPWLWAWPWHWLLRLRLPTVWPKAVFVAGDPNI